MCVRLKTLNIFFCDFSLPLRTSGAFSISRIFKTQSINSLICEESAMGHVWHAILSKDKAETLKLISSSRLAKTVSSGLINVFTFFFQRLKKVSCRCTRSYIFLFTVFSQGSTTSLNGL